MEISPTALPASARAFSISRTYSSLTRFLRFTSVTAAHSLNRSFPTCASNAARFIFFDVSISQTWVVPSTSA
ncbi:hypothetical protein D9M69_500170 [compost metagenome]